MKTGSKRVEDTGIFCLSIRNEMGIKNSIMEQTKVEGYDHQRCKAWHFLINQDGGMNSQHSKGVIFLLSKMYKSNSVLKLRFIKIIFKNPSAVKL